MNIGFDAKRLFHNHTGLGNYSRDLVRILKQYYPDTNYVLCNPKDKTIAYFSDPSEFEICSPKGLWRKLHPLWRSYGIGFEPQVKNLDIFHGLSGEIPVNLPGKVKKIVTIHDLIFERYPELYSSFDRYMHRRKFQHAVDHADVIVAISEQTKADISSYLKVPLDKIQVIYQGCSNIFKESFTTEQLQQTRSKFGLPEQFVLNVGTLEQRKNAFSLVKAIRNLDSTLVLIGRQTAYCKEIHQYIAQHNLGSKVMFLKNVSQVELAHIYSLSTVFAYPSIFEGFGIPIIEAMFCNTVVVTTNSGVFPEAAGPDSIYVDPYNVQEITQKINTLLQDQELREAIALKGRAYVEKFQDQQIAKNWQQVYQSVL